MSIFTNIKHVFDAVKETSKNIRYPNGEDITPKWTGKRVVVAERSDYAREGEWMHQGVIKEVQGDKFCIETLGGQQWLNVNEWMIIEEEG